MSVQECQTEIPLPSAPKQQIIGRPFKPGQSGNPNGRPKLIAQIRDLSRSFTEEAILGLMEIARDGSQPGSARVAAFTEVLDRGWGKAPQKYEVEVSVFESLSPEARALLDGVCDLLMQRMEAERATVIDVTPAAL